MLLMILSAMLFCACSGQPKENGKISSKDFLGGKDSLDGLYTASAAVYPTAVKQASSPEYCYGIFDGKLYYFDFTLGNWTFLGPLEETGLSRDDVASLIRDDYIDQERFLDPKSELLKAGYVVHSDMGDFYLRYGGSYNPDNFLAWKRENEIDTMWHLGKIDQFREEQSMFLRTTEEPIAPKLILRAEERTYMLYIPSVNFVSEGTFYFKEDRSTVALLGDKGEEFLEFQSKNEELIYSKGIRLADTLKAE
ncbi:MAG: hypothetical protein IJ091_07380 [Oscillospiraceae bacterium]|nr:hypothetical protein [Oscillospiraceae bacterium]